jgi:pyruvate,orthophosphate dikinase
VSGRRTPDSDQSIARALPAIARELGDILRRLEQEFGDVQDIEFTIEDGKLWILQTRSAKRTPRAALRIAIDLVHEGLITPKQALQRIDGIDFAALGQTRLAEVSDPVISGIGASGGIAVGRAAFDSASAQRLAEAGEPVILLRPDTSTADVAGFAVAAGIVTAVGARTAHAALVARQMGRPCIVGCAAMVIDTDADSARLGDATLAAGDWICIDGDGGHIYLGRREIIVSRPEAELAEIEGWRLKRHGKDHDKSHGHHRADLAHHAGD